jgi:hypothetical protein
MIFDANAFSKIPPEALPPSIARLHVTKGLIVGWWAGCTLASLSFVSLYMLSRNTVRMLDPVTKRHYLSYPPLAVFAGVAMWIAPVIVLCATAGLTVLRSKRLSRKAERQTEMGSQR